MCLCLCVWDSIRDRGYNLHFYVMTRRGERGNAHGRNNMCKRLHVVCVGAHAAHGPEGELASDDKK